MAELSFDQITEHLYVGERLNPMDWYLLAGLGITVNINLMAERQDTFSGSAPEAHLWLPSSDWFGPGLEVLRTSCQFISMMIGNGRLVYVHCNAGIGRAPTVASAYMITQGLSMEKAMEHVKERRPMMKLNGPQRSNLEIFEAEWVKNGAKR